MANGRTPVVRGVIAFHGMSLDTWRHEASLDGKVLTLTRTEFAILFILLAQPGFVHSRVQLADLLHPGEYRSSGSAIDSHVKNLRKKFRAIRPNSKVIRAIYGVGYKWCG